MGTTTVRLVENRGYQWYTDGIVSVKGSALLNDETLLSGEGLLSHFKSVRSEEGLKTALASLNGLFSVVINDQEILLVVVDIVRNFPLLYHLEGNNLTISDNYHTFINNKNKLSIDEEAEISMQHITWVPGNKTLIKNVFQLQAGEYLVYKVNQLKTAFWHYILPSVTKELSKEEWKLKIRECFFDIGKRLSLSIGDRPVVLPLSGGYDSRLIGLLLKLNGHKNVFCYTYGYKDCKEALNSKEIAKRLEYPWMIVDYEPYTHEDFTQSPQFLEYADFMGNAITYPYLQDYFAVKYLNEEQRLPENAIFLPGHSGDSIGGCSFAPDMATFRSKRDLSMKIFRIYGHGIYPSKKNKNLILDIIENNIDIQRLKTSTLAYEDWQKQESHAKHLVNSSKVFSYFGYEHLLPLSDKYYYDLFVSLPIEFRMFKTLHEETLKELFSEYGISLDNEITTSLRKVKNAHKLLLIRELFPFLTKLKRKKFSSDFYPYEQLLAFMKKDSPPLKYKGGSAIQAAWYIQLFKKIL